MSDQQDYPGQEHVDTQSAEFNTLEFIIEQVISRMSTATLVQVQKSTTNGSVAPPGTVNVSPLVKLQDAFGTVYPHSVVNNIPHYRLQAGTKAIIMDPKANDIGMVVFADRDISNVKKNKAASPPGSFRRFNMADGMYFPSMLGEQPTSYIQFEDDGTIVLSPDNGTTVVTIKAGKVQINMGTVKLSLQPNRVDINCDYGVGDSRVLCEAGPIPNVWAKST